MSQNKSATDLNARAVMGQTSGPARPDVVKDDQHSKSLPALYQASREDMDEALSGFDQTPGPVYELGSSFGAQVSSMNETFPSVKFLQRNFPKGQFISKKHTQDLQSDAPGPGQYSIPDFKSTGQKFSTAAARKDHAFKTITPGHLYRTWKEPCEDMKVRVVFGKAKRFAAPSRAKTTTGPGQYEKQDSIDGQRLAKTIAGGWGTAKLFYPGCDKVYLGKTSPGPGPAKVMNFGKDAPTVKFSQEKREFGHFVSGVGIPGPGTYNTGGSRSFLGQSFNSEHRSKPAARWGKPRQGGRIKNLPMMNKFSKSAWGFN